MNFQSTRPKMYILKIRELSHDSLLAWTVSKRTCYFQRTSSQVSQYEVPRYQVYYPKLITTKFILSKLAADLEESNMWHCSWSRFQESCLSRAADSSNPTQLDHLSRRKRVQTRRLRTWVSASLKSRKKVEKESQSKQCKHPLRGSATFGYFFLLLNLESWNLACLCKIEIP